HAQRLRAAARAPGRGGSARRDVGKHRRRGGEDGDDFFAREVGSGLRAFGSGIQASSLAMFHTDDTIVAIATPPGRGGLGVVRISGRRALEFAGAFLQRGPTLQPRYATFTRVKGDDEVIATYFPAPHSYT